MDGSTISDIDSPFNGITLPDLSESYICGGNIVCLTSGDFDCNNMIDAHTHILTHTHPINSHTHVVTTTHTGHDVIDTGYAQIGINSSGNLVYNLVDITKTYASNSGFYSGTVYSQSNTVPMTKLNGSVGTPLSPLSLDSTYSAQNSQDSTSVSNETTSEYDSSVKLDSIKVRYYLRYK
jgi:hypothetical protein